MTDLSSFVATDLLQIMTEQMGKVTDGTAFVGSYSGYVHGVIDWLMNRAALSLFYVLFFQCYFMTQFFTFFLNDEGVAFYQCYKRFPAEVTFF